MKTAAIVVIVAWTALLLYVFIDVRRVMAFNSYWNRKLGGGWPTEVTERLVVWNRIALAALLVVSDALFAWAFL